MEYALGALLLDANDPVDRDRALAICRFSA
jgi:hypothetical protein